MPWWTFVLTMNWCNSIEQLVAKNFLIPAIISLMKLLNIKPINSNTDEQHHCILHWVWQNGGLRILCFNCINTDELQFQLCELLSAKEYNFNFRSLISSSRRADESRNTATSPSPGPLAVMPMDSSALFRGTYRADGNTDWAWRIYYERH